MTQNESLIKDNSSQQDFAKLQERSEITSTVVQLLSGVPIADIDASKVDTAIGKAFLIHDKIRKRLDK